MEKSVPGMGMSKIDWLSVGKGLVIAMVGAGLVYLANWVKITDFGVYTPVITGLAAVLFNLAWKTLDNVKAVQ